MKQLLLLLVAVASLSVSNAAETTEIEVPPAKNILAVKRFASAKFGNVNVILRTDGEVMARPYLIEFRAECAKGAATDWKKLKIIRNQSACDTDASNISYEKKHETIVVRYRDTDAADYNRQSKEPDVKSPVMKCTKKVTVMRLTVAELCAQAAEDPAANYKKPLVGR